jgi:hypothetical protein
MKNHSLLHVILCCAAMALACGGCATAPHFQPVTEIPAGRGLVYLYTENGINDIWHNDRKLGRLTPKHYLVHYPEPGKNSYGFRMGYLQRGGLIGLMLDQQDPAATTLNIEPGKACYLRMEGSGMSASLWRVEESTALPQLQNRRFRSTASAVE